MAILKLNKSISTVTSVCKKKKNHSTKSVDTNLISDAFCIILGTEHRRGTLPYNSILENAIVRVKCNPL